MPSKPSEDARRERANIELERTLRSMETLPREERLRLLRELAAAPRQASAAAEAVLPVKPDGFDQERLKQFKRLCKRFWLSQHVSSVLRNFVTECLEDGYKSGPGRMTPLEEIAWNLAPFFKLRTSTGRPSRISWEDVAQFLDAVQESWRVSLDGSLKPSAAFSAEARALSVLYKRMRSRAPRPPYNSRIGSLLARHRGNYLPRG